MSRVQTGALGIVVIMALLITSTDSVAFETYSTDGKTGNCASCHGEFKGNDYTSNVDGTAWNDHLMKGHENFIGDSGNSKCDVCHSGSNRSPTYLSLSDLPAKPHGCVGCHGRTEDGPGQTGDGLRAHHMGADAYTNWPGGIPGFLTCANCHPGDTATPVGEEILPFNYFLTGTVSDPCTSENQFGPTGLDNDGDGAVDTADADCAMIVPTPGDFDLDGNADILWRHAISGRNVVHLLDGTTILTNADVSTVAAPQWQIVGKGDYNGDDKADMLWRDGNTGRIVMHFMDGASILSTADVATVSDPQWQIVGNGDYNGDTKSDMLWRHGISGRNVVLLMDGATILSNTESSLIVSQQWQVVGNGDYNGDTKSDVLWRHSGTGRNVVHLMDGATILSNTDISIVPAPQWQVVGNGDYNGDTKSDILWRDGSTGRIVVHLMDGTSIIGNSDISVVSDGQWQIVGSGDCNGDTKADILWRHGGTGRNVVHLMDGATILSNTEISTISDQQWTVVNTP